MNQSRLRIMCIYHNREPSYLGSDPEFELEKCEVTVVNSYAEAKKEIFDSKRGIPPFDLVLSDVTVPHGNIDDTFDDFPFCTILLLPYLNEMLVRGFGVFIPDHYETFFESSDGFSVVVVSKECFTPLGTRNWKKLLGLVLKAFDEADTFKIRNN